MMQASDDLTIPEDMTSQAPVYGSRTEMMQNFWRRMCGVYGRAEWVSENGDVDGDEFQNWSNEMADLSADQIRGGLKDLVREGREDIVKLVRFHRMCRATTKEPSPAQNTRKRDHYSVMRIERAKQVALMGTTFPLPAVDQNRLEKDWTDQDEQQLHDLIEQWDPSTELKGLNELIDHHQFSGGTHHAKTHRRAAPGGFD